MLREEKLILLSVHNYYFLFTSESRSAAHKAIVIHNKHSLAVPYCIRCVFLFFFFCCIPNDICFSLSPAHTAGQVKVIGISS